jgi:hypothetical protein
MILAAEGGLTLCAGGQPGAEVSDRLAVGPDLAVG